MNKNSFEVIWIQEQQTNALICFFHPGHVFASGIKNEDLQERFSHFKRHDFILQIAFLNILIMSMVKFV